MPTRIELEYAGGFLLFLLLLVPFLLPSSFVEFIPKLWRTWKGKKDKPEVNRSVTR
jgi:hypothetical protein